jgi:hypothetical protein
MTSAQSVSLFGETYTNQTTVGGTLDPRNFQSSPVLIASMSCLTIDEGDVVFIRSEVNYVNSVEINRYALVQDNVAPTLSGVLLVSDSDVSPFVAKAGDKIRIIVASNEPIVPVLNIPYAANKTGYVFKSSGFLLTSGFTSTTQADENAGIKRASGLVTVDGTNYTTITYNHIIVPIAVQDTEEGYFNFGNITFKDRADKTSLIQSSDFINKVWIDPIPPVVTVSGITVSGVTTTDPTSGIVVSGIIDLEFLFAETYNDVTEGQVYYSGVLRGSGIATELFLGNGSGLWSTGELINSGTSVVDSTFLDLYEINTFDLINGEYVITIYAEDYVGNTTEFEFLFEVDNDLTMTSFNINYDDQNAFTKTVRSIEISFNSFVDTSGLVNGISNGLIEFIMTSGNTVIRHQNGFDVLKTNPIITRGETLYSKTILFTLPNDPVFRISGNEFNFRVVVLENSSLLAFGTTKDISGPIEAFTIINSAETTGKVTINILVESD